TTHTYFPTVSVLFFFSRRRRHTSFSRDWSSDVCSSDLFAPQKGATPEQAQHLERALGHLAALLGDLDPPDPRSLPLAPAAALARPEERRVGRQCGARGWTGHGRRNGRDAGRAEQQWRRR